MPEYPAGAVVQDPNAVHRTGNETVAGVKAYQSAPTVPANSFAEDRIAGLVADLAAKVTATHAVVNDPAVFVDVRSNAAVIGDAVNDDTVGLRERAGIVTPGGVLFFSRPPVAYRITDQLDFGTWVIDGANNVMGSTGAKVGLTVRGAFNTSSAGVNPEPSVTIFWDGPNQPGTTTTAITDSVGTYTYVTDAKPMMNVVGGRHISFERLSLDGRGKAYTGVQHEGDQYNISYRFVDINNVKIPVRQGVGWDYQRAVPYFGRGDDPYLKANVRNAPSTGGWQTDTFTVDHCTLQGTLTCFSQESAQADNTTIANSNLVGAGGTLYGVSQVGGVLNLVGMNFIGAIATADVNQITGSNRLYGRDVHSESGATHALSTIGSAVSQSVTLIDCDWSGGDIRVNGGGINLVAMNSQLGVINRAGDGNCLFSVTLLGGIYDHIQLLASAHPGNVYLDVSSSVPTAGYANQFQGPGVADKFLATRYVPLTPVPAEIVGVTGATLNGQNGAWQTVDCSSQVPLGAQAVAINGLIHDGNNAGATVQLRQNGAAAGGIFADATTVQGCAPTAGPYVGFGGIVPLDTARKLQYKPVGFSAAGGDVEVAITGYYL